MAWHNWFPQILDMSLTASAVIGIVLLLRLVLKRAPRIFSYALWLVVLFRLLCPVAPSAPVGVLREAETVRQGYTLAEEAIAFPDAAQAAYRAAGDAVNGGLGAQHIPTAEPDDAGARGASSLWWETWVLFGQYVWLAGIGAMLLNSAAQYARLRRRLIGAARLRDNIWRADHIDTPFVMGVLRPQIYLPTSITESERGYVLAHEKHHIRRGDPLWRLLAFAALCLHWFNPLVWLAFALSRKDMEMSCDEAVTRGMDGSVRAAYSQSLLRFATGRKIAIGAPLAFGEGDTKERIVHVMKYKKPKILATALAALLCVGAVTVFAFNAEKSEEPPRELTAREALDALAASVDWWDDSAGGLYASFTLPKNYPVENWNIHISGRAEYEDGMSMSRHYFEGEDWQAGNRYIVEFSHLTELLLVATLSDENGVLEREINLLPYEADAADRIYNWSADLDGDGRPEIIRLNASLLEENAFSVPWIELADGTKLCELNPLGSPHATWNTYALTELDGRAYLLEYRPYRGTGTAEYSYTLWMLDGRRLVAAEARSVVFPDYEPMLEEQIDAVVAFAGFTNGLWSRSRLLFTTDPAVMAGLYEDGRRLSDPSDQTDADFYFANRTGHNITYIEDMDWITDELVEEDVFDGHLGLRERLVEYKTLSEQRYAEYLKNFSD